MELSPGFLVVAFCGNLLVVLPSLGTAWILWRKGGLHRVVAVAVTVLMLGMVPLGFVDAELPRQLEEAVLSALLLWAVSFYAFVGLGATGLLLRYVIGLTRRSGRPHSAAELKP